jgi:hypothetical protein
MPTRDWPDIDSKRLRNHNLSIYSVAIVAQEFIFFLSWAEHSQSEFEPSCSLNLNDFNSSIALSSPSFIICFMVPAEK